MMLVTEFAKLHNLSRGWASYSKKYYPDAFYFIGDRQYVYPEKVWYKRDEINQEYHGAFFKRMNNLYFEVVDHFIDYRIAKLLSINSDIKHSTWITYLAKLRFKKGAKADEFMERCELILTLIGEYGEDYEGIKAELLTIK